MIETALMLLFKLLIAGLIFWLLWWGTDKIGELILKVVTEEPFNKMVTVVIVVLKVILVIAAVIFCVDLLMGLAGIHSFKLP